MTDLRLLYVTTMDAAQARTIATELLNRRLIACANILPQMDSLYRWEGKIRTESEAVLILKTRQNLVAAVTEAIHELHTYETPCVLALGIDSGAAGYVDWLNSELI